MDLITSVLQKDLGNARGLLVVGALALFTLLYKQLATLAEGLFQNFIKPDPLLVVVLLIAFALIGYQFNWLFVAAVLPAAIVVALKIRFPEVLEQTCIKAVSIRVALLAATILLLGLSYTGLQIWPAYRLWADRNKVIAVVLSADLEDQNAKLRDKDVSGVLTVVKDDLRRVLTDIDTVEIIPNERLGLSAEDIDSSLQTKPDSNMVARFEALDRFRKNEGIPINFELTDRVLPGDADYNDVEHRITLWRFDREDGLKPCWPSAIDQDAGYFLEARKDAETARVALIVTVAILNYLTTSDVPGSEKVRHDETNIWMRTGNLFVNYLSAYNELYTAVGFVAMIRRGQRCSDKTCVAKLAKILRAEPATLTSKTTAKAAESNFTARLSAIAPTSRVGAQ